MSSPLVEGCMPLNTRNPASSPSPSFLHRVLELQESPCLPGSGIVIAVEGPCSASLLAKHGPLPDRSYICLVRPRRKVGTANAKGGVDVRGGGGTFDAAYYWHGVGETPAVEGVSAESRGKGRAIPCVLVAVFASQTRAVVKLLWQRVILCFTGVQFYGTHYACSVLSSGVQSVAPLERSCRSFDVFTGSDSEIAGTFGPMPLPDHECRLTRIWIVLLRKVYTTIASVSPCTFVTGVVLPPPTRTFRLVFSFASKWTACFPRPRLLTTGRGRAGGGDGAPAVSV